MSDRTITVREAPLRKAKAMGIKFSRRGSYFCVEPVDESCPLRETFTLSEFLIYLDGYRDGSRAHGAVH